MNLVQINERLKDLPVQVIQQYANGMNPEVPPYLALGELQRREIAQKQMATAQGGMQGPQPSIKEQVEQRAGLMAAQGLQQQQQMQQMAQPRGPMPAPEGIPQPEAQPEMMASGGLAAVPVRREMFDYAGGGIVAFAEGESVEDPRRERKEGESFADFRKRMFALDLQLQREKNAQENSARESERQRRLSERGEEFQVPPSPFVDRPALPLPAREPLVTSQGPDAPVVPRRPIEPAAGLAAALQKTAQARPAPAAPIAAQAAAPRPAAPTPAPAPQAGLPAAAQNVTPFLQEAAAMARDKPVAPTPEGIIAEQNKLLPPGMQEAAMQKRIADQRARAEQERAAYEKSRPSGLDELINMLGQAGRSKGLSGMAPAYTAIEQQKRAQDLAMEKRQNELLTAIEGRDYEGAKELFGARDKSMTAANKAFQERLMTNTKTLADLAGVDQRRMDEALNRLSQEKLERLRIAARAAEASRPGEAERIEAQYMRLIAQNKPQEAEEYLNRISRIKGGSTAGVGADNAQTRKLRDAVKDIDARLETMSSKEPEYLTLKAQRDRLSKLIIDRAIGEAGVPGADAKSGVVDKSNPLLK
jgi:hypothetical protein